MLPYPARPTSAWPGTAVPQASRCTRPAAAFAGLAWLGAAALAALVAATPVQAGPTLDRIKQSGQVVIGHRESSVPFSYVLPDGRPAGYAVDLCLRVVDAVRRNLQLKTLPVRYQVVTSSNRIDLVASGQVDLECGSTTNNADRRAKVAFTIPHYITGARLLVKADSPVAELKDLSGKRVASTAGSTPLKVIREFSRERGLGLTVVEASEHARGVAMVASGEASAFVMDDVLLFGLIAGRTDPPPLKVVGKLLSVEPLAIMMSRDDPAFKRIVDDELRRLIGSREAHALYDRWFRQPIPPRNVALDLPMNNLLRDFWKYPTDQVPN